MFCRKKGLIRMPNSLLMYTETTCFKTLTCFFFAHCRPNLSAAWRWWSCWDGRPFGHHRHGPKSGGAVPLSVGEARSPSNTVLAGSRLTCRPNGILIHPAVWPQQTRANNGGCAPLYWGGMGAGSPSKKMWHGPRPTSIPSGILIHRAVWAQYTGR